MEDIFDTQSMDYEYTKQFYEGRNKMIVDPEDDPRLDNVQRKLKALRKFMDEWEWQGKNISPARRAEIKRLTMLLAEGKLYEPKF